MPRYQQKTQGKLIVQDWDVLSTYDDELVLRAITPKMMSALVALAEFLGWRTRYLNPPSQDTIDSFEAETRYRLMQEVEICALFIACITDDEDVREALNQWFIDQINDTSSDVYNSIQQVYQQNVGGQPMPPSISGKPLIEVPDCDLDTLFGAIFYTVDEMNEANFDAQQSAEAITNVLERASLLIGGVPVFETLPVDEFFNYVQTIWTDDLFEAYAANDTEGYRDELRCDLFCIAQNNGCTLTIDLMFEYFVNRIGGDPQNDFAQLITYLTTGTWTGTQVNDIFYALQLIAMKLGNQFFQFLGLKSISTLLAIGARMPDSTWSIICETCVVCVDPDFRVVNPLGYSGGSVMVTDNMDGTWTAVMTAVFDTDGYRLGIVESNTGCCYETIAVEYSSDPENLNAQYNCGANPDDTDYGNGIGTGALTIGLCAAGIIASDVDEPFTVTWTFRHC